MLGFLLQQECLSPKGLVPLPEKGIECGIPEFLAVTEAPSAFGYGARSFLWCERCNSRFGLWMKQEEQGVWLQGLQGL